MPSQGPRIILIGGTYRALCVLERLIERGERVVGFIGQEGTQERDFCPEILEVCDRHSIPARSAHKFGEEIVRWLENRIRPELVLAVGLETQVPLAIGGNSRLGLVEILDSFESRDKTRVLLRQKGQSLIGRRTKPLEQDSGPGDSYLEMIDTALDVLDEYLDGILTSSTPAPRRVCFEPSFEPSLRPEGVGVDPATARTTLESEAAEFLGAERVWALRSAAEAFNILVSELAIGEGDEIVCPAYCSRAAAVSFEALGVKTHFVDLEPDTLALDPAQLQRAISRSTRAILVSHPFGQAAALDQIYPLAEQAGLEVLEDAGRSLGTRFDESRVGRSPCTSVFELPLAGTSPDAALLALPNSLAARLEDSARAVALPDAEALQALAHFRGWEDELQARALVGRAYNDELARYDAFRLPVGRPLRPAGYAGYALSLTRFARTSADDLHRLLLEGGVETRRLSLPARERDLADLPVAESARHNTIVLPAHSGLSEEDLQLLLDLLFDYAIG